VIDTFERGEPLSTGQTFATTTNRCALLGDTGIDDLGVIGATDGTEHPYRVLRGRRRAPAGGLGDDTRSHGRRTV
jgi:hypothetical protein